MTTEKPKRKPGRPPGGPGGPGRPAAEMPAAEWEPLAVELAELTGERDELQLRLNEAQQAIDVRVRKAHEAGASWAQLAAGLGVSRQAVYRRYVTGKTPDKLEDEQGPPAS